MINDSKSSDSKTLLGREKYLSSEFFEANVPQNCTTFRGKRPTQTSIQYDRDSSIEMICLFCVLWLKVNRSLCTNYPRFTVVTMTALIRPPDGMTWSLLIGTRAVDSKVSLSWCPHMILV